MTLTLVLATLILTAAAHAKRPSTQLRLSNAIVATWTCETQQGLERTKAPNPWKPHSEGWRRAQLNTWVLRRKACIAELHRTAHILAALRRGLTGTPMQGTERALEAAGRRWHISPAFIAAIAGTESSFGAAACRDKDDNLTFNAYGLASCGTSWHVPSFATWAASYQFMGRFLTSRWPHARTTYDYHGYAACASCWGRKTAEHMRRFGAGPTVVYA